MNHNGVKRDDENKQSSSSSHFFGLKLLKPCDLRELVERKQREHFQGSREWLFEEVREWVRGGGAEGGAGDRATGASEGAEDGAERRNTNNNNPKYK